MKIVTISALTYSYSKKQGRGNGTIIELSGYMYMCVYR